MELAGTIRISRSPLYNMIRSIVEEPREPIGYLYGTKRGKTFTITNAYSVQTAERKPTQAEYGNMNAVKRLMSIDQAISANGDTEGSFLGSYHSHPIRSEDTPNQRRGLNHLGRSDLNFVEEEMDKRSLEQWVEILLKIESKEYDSRREIGIFTVQHERKLSVFLRDEPHHGYRMTISAYLISRDMRVRELRVKRRKIKVMRAT